jgi:DNA-binding GntR family transcriptional regulator
MLTSADTAASALTPVGQVHRRVRVSDRVYDELVQAIRDLRLFPGQPISENDLTVAMQVSRTPIREALGRLAEGGLVTVIPQVGTRVSLISLGEVREAQFVREHLEVAAFAEGCATSDLDVSPLRVVLAEQAKAVAVGDIGAFFETDEEFHSTLFGLTGHTLAWETVHAMKVQLDRVRRLSVPVSANLNELLAEHTAITNALEAGEAGQGCALVARHARRVLDYAPDLLTQHPDWVTE